MNVMTDGSQAGLCYRSANKAQIQKHMNSLAKAKNQGKSPRTSADYVGSLAGIQQHSWHAEAEPAPSYKAMALEYLSCKM